MFIIAKFQLILLSSYEYKNKRISFCVIRYLPTHHHCLPYRMKMQVNKNKYVYLVYCNAISPCNFYFIVNCESQGNEVVLKVERAVRSFLSKICPFMQLFFSSLFRYNINTQRTHFVVTYLICEKTNASLFTHKCTYNFT